MPARGTAPSVRSLQGKCAAARRWDLPNKDDLVREYAAARLEDYIRRIVADAPPLSTAQRDRLSLLLRPIPTASSGDAAA